MKRRVALAALVLVALAGAALARPGGGQSYSGGGGHSSSGGSGGSGDSGAIFELIYWTIRLMIYYPQIGVPLLIGIIIVLVIGAHQQAKNRDWDSGPPAELERAIELSDLRKFDPDFSQIVFEDFVFRLFSTAHRARATAQSLATVAPYVSQAARDALAARDPVGVPVEQVVIGALRVARVDIPDDADAPDAPDARDRRVRVGVQLEANVATAQHTYYSVETWLFGRAASARSKPPGKARDLPCPNCGAPWQASATGTQKCASCGEIVDNGRFDWLVEQISLASQDERPPTLTTEVPERGTDLPTYRQPGVDSRFQQLLLDDPALDEAALRTRLAMIYDALNVAWSKNQLAPIRGFVSDGLYDYLQYWVAAYQRQGLRNELVDMRMTAATIAKVTRDRWYDAVTLRIWGTGKDFVVDARGEIVRGSKHRERAYSEYWTLIRSAGRKGAPKLDATCGNCGAPLRISMAGACEHCGAHVTGGEFDWVLSKIEQDDSYRG